MTFSKREYIADLTSWSPFECILNGRKVVFPNIPDI